MFRQLEVVAERLDVVCAETYIGPNWVAYRHCLLEIDDMFYYILYCPGC
jgi:hypothetical protein